MSVCVCVCVFMGHSHTMPWAVGLLEMKWLGAVGGLVCCCSCLVAGGVSTSYRNVCVCVGGFVWGDGGQCVLEKGYFLSVHHPPLLLVSQQHVRDL